MKKAENRKSVLVVATPQFNAAFIDRFFSIVDWRVVKKSLLADAFDVAASEKFNLIAIEYEVFWMAQFFKKNPLTSHIPIMQIPKNI